ncbi:gamma-glutamyl-gamma-aminobutyrate hydrolase family protein [Membranihabitans marinus]|uniref:gamma-glutamyl-gamma-aminobutyrate hydrolase family protein n=1 Tax=Membranihabitans marinus TaxID=1227546 RepID=UPI001F1B2B69|nr:gamma-glutamyl-gamma-aminobutyrate hydrolase family protein [Membranihabitans marinus]
MKKIGISACFMYPDVERTVFGHKRLNYIENDMSVYLTRKGILPVLIPDVLPEILADILDEMDGFVLQGGADIAPQTYGAQAIGHWEGDGYRDQYELKIMDYAIRHSKPLLGICRGFQLMNVYFGGSLYQDIATEISNAHQHRSAELYDTICHPIEWVKGSLFESLYSHEKNPHVNTVHHQAVKELGRDLNVYAHSDDGLIEAFGYSGAPEGKVMGVQWHPEFSHTLGDKVIDADILLDLFIQHL